jgi:hypothetical protein
MLSLLALCAWQLPSGAQLEQDATLETWTRRIHMTIPATRRSKDKHPGIADVSLTLHQLAVIRSMIASLIWTVSLQTLLGEGWVQETVYRPTSRLITVSNHMRGIHTMFPFTSVAWNLLGLYFSMAGYIAYTTATHTDAASSFQPHTTTQYASAFPSWLLQATLIVWTLAAPSALLVASVIRYGIWPAVLKANKSTDNLKSFRNIMMHNMNVLFVLVELILLGGVPVQAAYWQLAPLLGILYVFFSWSMAHRWNCVNGGPQYIYFFLDTTVAGYAASKALLVLLSALLGFFGLLAFLSKLLDDSASWSLFARVGLVLMLCSLTMRFRD